MRETCGIYAITSSINNKTYIGQSTTVLQRWRQHRYDLNSGKHLNSHLQAAWNKNGAAAFTFSLVKECAVEDLWREEAAALSKIPEALRYNQGPAGYSPTYGIRQRDEQKLKHSRAKGGRAFFAEDLTTGVVRWFEHGGEAKAAGFNVAHVYNCLHGDRATHQGHRFYYDPSSLAEPKLKKKLIAREKRNREIVGTCLRTGAEKRFPYVAAVVEAGFARTGVTKALSGELKQHRNFSWRYADGLPHRSMSKERREKLCVGPREHAGSCTVTATHFETGEVLTFPYAKKAAEHFNVSCPMIHIACSKGSKINRIWIIKKERAPRGAPS